MKKMQVATAAVLAVLAAGCVERVMTISSNPSGAIVWLNGQEAGATPLNVSFNSYGRYGVELRKDGFQTIRTPRDVNPPVYEWPVIDFFSECLWPGTLTDRHLMHFVLEPTPPADHTALVERAEALRDRCWAEENPSAAKP